MNHWSRKDHFYIYHIYIVENAALYVCFSMEKTIIKMCIFLRYINRLCSN